MSRVSKKEIYLDNAASTPINRVVQQAMAEANGFYANASSFNGAGRSVRKIIEEARSTTAEFIGARPGEVVFTSSGSEANNLAILGLISKSSVPAEIISTPIEHPSVRELLKFLEKKGWKIEYLKVDSEGFVVLQDLKQKLSLKTVLVSVIYANNEIGTIQQISQISRAIREFKRNNRSPYPFIHSDACQAAGYLDMGVNNLGVDTMSFNGTKIYGPRGVGVLYVRAGTPATPMVFGGGQEHGLRAGTESCSAIIGMAKAVSLVNRNDGRKTMGLRDYFLDNIIKVIPGTKINGPRNDNRLMNNINISIPDLDSENLLLELDKYGIYASSGSACTSRSVEPSHVLKAIGVEKRYLDGALRFSLGKQTTKKDIDYVLKVLPRVVGGLRKRYNKN